MKDLLNQIFGIETFITDNHCTSVISGSSGEPGEGESHEIRSPIDGGRIGYLHAASDEQVGKVVDQARQAALKFGRLTPARRGEFVHRIGERIALNKAALAEFVTLETGKTRQEALGEVQEMIDFCNHGVDVSARLSQLKESEGKPNQGILERWLPLGPVGILTAFNLPVSVWSLNAMLSFVCGNPVIWKPSERAPLCALACHAIVMEAREGMEDIPAEVSAVIFGGIQTGAALVDHFGVPLISATGSLEMGRAVAQKVAYRLGRCLLELGGNKAMVVMPSANLDTVLRGAVLAVVGTAGQRGKSLRRFIVHEEVREKCVQRLAAAFDKLSIGDPRIESNLMGPLANKSVFEDMQSLLDRALAEGAEVIGGERILKGVPEGGYYVRPAIVEGLAPEHELVQAQTFAPVVFILPFGTLDEGLAIHDGISQGISSAIFTDRLGIAGPDSWKNYVQHLSVTLNSAPELHLDRDVPFEI